ncbi:MAG: hypothetical protein IPI67_41950 [Myxococcales bacterium]|nr:hypothetical protein [Myxococcales bacterium]
MRVIADFESNSLVLFIVLWFVFFPIALILALMGYQEWERRQLSLFQAVWTPLGQMIAAPPGPQFGAGPQVGYRP